MAFGVTGATINLLYTPLRERQTIAHVLARQVQGASHMAEGRNRARAGNIGVCIGSSGSSGSDRPRLACGQRRWDPILCLPGQVPRVWRFNEAFQAADIEAIGPPVTKWRAPALVQRLFQQALHFMGSGRPGPVRIDSQIEVPMVDIDTYEVRQALMGGFAASRILAVQGGGGRMF